MAANNSTFAKAHKAKHEQLRREMAMQDKRRRELALTSHYLWSACNRRSFKTRVIVKQIGAGR